MTIQKKSLISSLNTTKKAIVATQAPATTVDLKRGTHLKRAAVDLKRAAVDLKRGTHLKRTAVDLKRAAVDLKRSFK